MGIISELGAAVRGVAEKVGPSVVGLGDGWRGGSGVVIAAGRVLTNAHNVRGEALTVIFRDRREAEARVRGFDADGDLAVLEVDTAGAPGLEWADAADVSVGEPVFALADPRGQGLRVSFGLVSGVERSFRGPRGRRIGGSIEHTAPLLPGSSGGPLVDEQGRLLGLNTNRLGEGFYLAIAAGPALRERADALGRGEAPRRRRLGIAAAPGHVARRLRRSVGLPDRDGILVREVDDQGPAAAAGIQEGDLIVAAGGKEVSSVDDLFDLLSGSAREIELTLVRGTDERSVKVQPVEATAD